MPRETAKGAKSLEDGQRLKHKQECIVYWRKNVEQVITSVKSVTREEGPAFPNLYWHE